MIFIGEVSVVKIPPFHKVSVSGGEVVKDNRFITFLGEEFVGVRADVSGAPNDEYFIFHLSPPRGE